MTAILEARDLSKHFALRGAGLFAKQIGTLRAVEAVSLTIQAGRCLALVGESGCGKTTLARCLALLHRPSVGSIRFDGKIVYDNKTNNYNTIRRDIQMVFQDPFSALNPRMTIAAIIAEPLVIHRVGDRRERAARVAELMDAVGLSPSLADRYPHEFSGGQRQRIGIARALALRPRLIIADEPVSALDVSVQSQVLNLMLDLQEELDLSYLFVSHDLAVVEQMADEVAVMYLGRIVEQAPRDALFAAPSHPYTSALMRSIPRPGGGKRKPGASVGGEVPSPLDPPPGCPFHPRCPRAADICREVRPLLEPIADDHIVACHFEDAE